MAAQTRLLLPVQAPWAHAAGTRSPVVRLLEGPPSPHRKDAHTPRHGSNAAPHSVPGLLALRTQSCPGPPLRPSAARLPRPSSDLPINGAPLLPSGRVSGAGSQTRSSKRSLSDRHSFTFLKIFVLPLKSGLLCLRGNFIHLVAQFNTSNYFQNIPGNALLSMSSLPPWSLPPVGTDSSTPAVTPPRPSAQPWALLDAQAPAGLHTALLPPSQTPWLTRPPAPPPAPHTPLTSPGPEATVGAAFPLGPHPQEPDLRGGAGEALAGVSPLCQLSLPPGGINHPDPCPPPGRWAGAGGGGTWF